MDSRFMYLGAALSALVVSSPIFAAQRTFVSTSGVNNPTCSLSAPCRDFAAAIAATSANGEVIVLDSGGYGPVTITQSASIIAPLGVFAGISVFPGLDGVTVNAGPTGKVTLRGLTINGQGGNNGVHVVSGKEVQIEDCTLAGLASNGVYVQGGDAVHIKRIVARGNGQVGVSIDTPPAPVMVTVTDSVLSSNVQHGFLALITPGGSTIHAALARVTSAGNGAGGFVANSGNVGNVTMTVADSVAAENGQAGVQASGTNATAVVSGSWLVRNATVDLLQSASAVLRTSGNNTLTGRGAADVSGTLTPNPMQ
jgi:hypothetical protein